jgi:hypothetical protein
MNAVLYTSLAVTLPVALWLVSIGYKLSVNYRIVRNLGLPVVVIPFNPESPLWMLLNGSVLTLLEHLPFCKGATTKFSRSAWDFYDRNRLLSEYPEGLWLVSPGRNWLYLWNAEAVHDVLQRKNDFPRAVELLGESSTAREQSGVVGLMCVG